MEAHQVTLERLIDINRALLDASVDGIRLVDLEGRTLLANSVIEHLTTQIFGIPKYATLQEGRAIADRLTDPASYIATMETIAADPALRDAGRLRARRRPARLPAPHRPRARLRRRADRPHHRRSARSPPSARPRRLKSELVATVSHELRTPLTGVLGFAELLMHHDLDEATSKRYLKTIHSEAQRLTALVDDFLDVQKIEAGRFTLALESFELGELLEHEVELFSRAVGEPPARVRRRRRAARDGRRPQPHRPGHRQPALQRDQVLARRRHRDDHGDAARGLRARAGQRLRPRHPGRASRRRSSRASSASTPPTRARSAARASGSRSATRS